VPQGWSFKEQGVIWNTNTYADPAHVQYTLRGPADEVEFVSLSRMQFRFNQAELAMLDSALNMITDQIAKACQMARQMGPAGQPLCAQANAQAQQTISQTQQQKQALVSGQAVEGGLISMQPMWAADFVQWLIRKNGKLSNVQVKRIEKPQDMMALLAKAVAELDPQMRQMAAALGVSCKGLSFDVARMEYSYTKDGKRYDETSLAITKYLTLTSKQRMQSLSPGGPDPVYGKEFVIWEVHLNGASALAGRLKAHDAALTAIAANSAVDPLWQAAVEKLAADTSQKINAARSQQQKDMLESEMKHQQKMQRMRQETFDYVNRSRQEVFARRSESLSKASSAWTDAITDRQVWESGGRKVVLPNDFKYAWGSGNKIIGSNDPGFNPNHSSDYSGDWQEMSKSSRF
jgi:hypothetical protein